MVNVLHLQYILVCWEAIGEAGFSYQEGSIFLELRNPFGRSATVRQNKNTRAFLQPLSFTVAYDFGFSFEH